MKKRLLAILFILTVFYTCKGQIDSLTIESYNNEIYSWIFKNYIYKLQQPNLRAGNTTIAIRETPKYFKTLDEKLLERIKTDYKKVQIETLEAFKAQIAVHLHLQNLNIPGFYIFIFNEITLPSSKDLEEKYENWNRKFIEFTPIGFNVDFSQAMLYFGYDGGHIGGGVILIFELKKGKWRFRRSIGVWAT